MEAIEVTEKLTLAAKSRVRNIIAVSGSCREEGEPDLEKGGEGVSVFAGGVLGPSVSMSRSVASCRCLTATGDILKNKIRGSKRKKAPKASRLLKTTGVVILSNRE